MIHGRQEIGLREPGGAGNSTHIGYKYLAIHDKSVKLLRSLGQDVSVKYQIPKSTFSLRSKNLHI